MRTMILAIAILIVQSSLLFAHPGNTDTPVSPSRQTECLECQYLIPIVPEEAIFEEQGEVPPVNPDQQYKPCVPETASFSDCPGQYLPEGSCLRPIIPTEAGYNEIF